MEFKQLRFDADFKESMSLGYEADMRRGIGRTYDFGELDVEVETPWVYFRSLGDFDGQSVVAPCRGKLGLRPDAECIPYVLIEIDPFTNSEYPDIVGYFVETFRTTIAAGLLNFAGYPVLSDLAGYCDRNC